MLIRLLSHYALHRRPSRLELINTSDFPGAMPFIGLGQLPPEALRLLWATRRSATAAQLQLGLATWKALVNADPRPLAALMRTGTPALPLLASAPHRHLRELPASITGLSLTEEVALQSLAAKPSPLFQLVGRMIYSLLRLSGHGDTGTLNRVLAMEQASENPFVRRPGLDQDGELRAPWSTCWRSPNWVGRCASGEVDFRTLNPPPRWVGGVHVASGNADWRWDDALRDAVRQDQGPSTP